MARVTAVLIFLLILSVPSANRVVGQEPKAELAERVDFQFSDGIKDASLVLVGPDVGSTVSVQPEGLRFNIPAGRKNTGNVGVESQLRLHGDFEITLDYDLLSMPTPGPKYVVGAFLQIALDTPDDLRVRVGRASRASGPCFHAEVINLGANGKNIFRGFSSPPADDKATKGRLRFVRTGDTLSCLVQQGDAEFSEIAKKEIGRADVVSVQATSVVSGQPVALDIRYPRLQIRASSIPNKLGPTHGKAANNSPAPGERIEFQFSEGVAKNPMLRFAGPDAEAMAAVQPQGLLFNVPAARQNTGDVGVEARMRLRGDFVITLDYELVDLPKPPPKLGAGAVLQIVLDSPDARKARMDRLHRPKDDVFGANCVVNGEFRGLAAPHANDKETKGRLRMVRTDALLSYQVQEGSVPFYEIAKYDIGRDDVIAVQALCATGWQPAPVGIRFQKLAISSSKAEKVAENVPAVDPPPEAERPAAPGNHISLLLVIGLGLIVSLLAMAGLSIYLWRSARPGAAKAPSQDVGFSCPECGKKLAVKPALAGKKVKCPHCGKTVLVAESTKDQA